jgi:hypothetical protein
LLADIGLTVAREIPLHAVAGLVSGAYSLHGGVVRDVSGRIVAHLLTPGPIDLIKGLVPGLDVLSSLVGNRQIYLMAKDLSEVRLAISSVLSISAAGSVLSGLGLVATVAGFAFLNRRIGEVQRRVEKIGQVMAVQQLAVLKGATDNLRHAELTLDSETRRGLLLDAKRDFAQCSHFYGDQYANAVAIEEAAVMGDCYALSAVGTSTALSELGMYDVAAVDFEGQVERWTPLSRAHVLREFVGENRYRLIHEELVERLPAEELVQTLDFAYEDQKAWGWIDKLRKEKADQAKAAGFKGIPMPWPKSSDLPSDGAIGLAAALRAKHGALEAYAEHLRFLATKKISATAFALAAESARKESGEQAICLVPVGG